MPTQRNGRDDVLYDASAFDALRRMAASRGAAAIERKAEKFANPIERLQYLRQATSGASWTDSRSWKRLAALLLGASVIFLRSDAGFHRPPDPQPVEIYFPDGGAGVPNVWIVEGGKDFEVYSNGLRIETGLAVSNQARSFPPISREGTGGWPRRAQPAGIVYHTTESHQAPLEADQNRRLRQIAQDLLLLIRSKRAYHFVIDRFGRVHRIVVESDEANHSGRSVWADAHWQYLNLNASFLGVAFEASTQTNQPPIDEAQIHAAKVLTEMLRSKYNLAAENCVTHAQVSVNPDNMRIGWHTDWGKDFPFGEIGLPANYERPLPSLCLFGFEYDPLYRNATGPELWKGLALSDEQVKQAAAERGMTLWGYRSELRKRYREQVAWVKP